MYSVEAGRFIYVWSDIRDIRWVGVVVEMTFSC